MRIVLVTELWYPDTFGGSERFAAETAGRLAARGHEVTVWTLRNARADLPGREEAGGLTVRRHGDVARYGRRPRTLSMLGVGRRAAPDARAADLVITHHLWPSLALGLARPGTPILHQFHASPTLEWRYAAGDASRQLGSGPLRRVRPAAFRAYGALMRLAERRVVGQAAAVTVLSEFSRSLVADQHPGALGRVTLVPGGVSTERFRPADDRDAVRRRLGVAPGERLLVSVRRMVPRMGLGELIRAVGRLAPAMPGLRLALVGDGPLRADLEAESRARGLEGVVRFAGRVDDAALLDHYRAADLFVLPTQAYEGFGMVTLEALACGTPVVATPAGASPEILLPLDPELVSADPGERALADALSLWLARDLEPLRARARAHALTYDWERVMDRYEALCAAVAERRPGPGRPG